MNFLVLPTGPFVASTSTLNRGDKFYSQSKPSGILGSMRGTTPAIRTCVLLVTSASLALPVGGQNTFASPAKAAQALAAAIAANDHPLFRSTVGLDLRDVLDAFPRLRFFDENPRILMNPDVKDSNRILLYVGDIGQPFPAPLVNTDSGWWFDAEAGAKQTADQRIRRNESAARELCLRYVNAQIEYSSRGGGMPIFAQQIRSTPGLTDGLYWSDDGDESPLGPSFAYAAFTEPQQDGGPRPLFGYYFKILLGQGSHAAGGPTDYRVNGRLRNGFALVAWPAMYGHSGLHTYLVNHLGRLYQKDLGTDSGRAAAEMSVFNPDRSWKLVKPDGDEERSAPIVHARAQRHREDSK